MELPVKISYRGLEKSDQIDNLVLEYAARLDKFCDHINRCDVAIEQRNHAHQKGNPYHVRIDVTVRPRHELVAREEQMENSSPAPFNYGVCPIRNTPEPLSIPAGGPRPKRSRMGVGPEEYHLHSCRTNPPPG